MQLDLVSGILKILFWSPFGLLHGDYETPISGSK